jgi:hypothetical protein
MNNSDQNDFDSWKNNDDENDMRNPNNWFPKGGFFYYGPVNNDFKNIWESMGNQDEFVNNMKNYLNMDDIMEQFKKSASDKPKKNIRSNRPKPTVLTHEDYNKLIEIRGYLAIKEQYSHVKALDKVLNHIQIIKKEEK